MSLQRELGYGEEDVLVIAHVDDIGMHPDETAGSLDVLRFGMARTGSVMVPAPDFGRFAGIWANDPAFDIGVHVTLNSEWPGYRWGPVLAREHVPSLVDSAGYLWNRELAFRGNADVGEAIREMEAQVERVLSLGLSPTHLDQHMECFYYSRELFTSAVRLARRHGLVIPYAPAQMLEPLRERGFVVADTCSGFYEIAGEEQNNNLRATAYETWLRGLGPGVHFIYLHPARVTPDLGKIIESPYLRAGDLEYWTSPAARDLAAELGIHFIGLRELQELQRERMKGRSI